MAQNQVQRDSGTTNNNPDAAKYHYQKAPINLPDNAFLAFKARYRRARVQSIVTMVSFHQPESRLSFAQRPMFPQ